MNTAQDAIAEINDPAPAVDVAGLVAAGLLNLSLLTTGAQWETGEPITYFTDYATYDNLVQVHVVLQCVTVYGITVYRWAELYEDEIQTRGEPTLDRDQAVEDGSDFATENDQDPDYAEIN